MMPSNSAFEFNRETMMLENIMSEEQIQELIYFDALEDQTIFEIIEDQEKFDLQEYINSDYDY